jgi:hypothetical protein
MPRAVRRSPVTTVPRIAEIIAFPPLEQPRPRRRVKGVKLCIVLYDSDDPKIRQRNSRMLLDYATRLYADEMNGVGDRDSRYQDKRLLNRRLRTCC